MTAGLACPVCSDSVDTLQQLNEHLDRRHPVDGSGEPGAQNGGGPGGDSHAVAAAGGSDRSGGSDRAGDRAGAVVVDKTARFRRLRKRHVDRMALTRTKLEIRLVKLLTGLQALANTKSAELTIWNRRDVAAMRRFETELVNWEDDSVFERCRFCGQRFSFFVRKHHCRVCGLVTCGDVERECSLEVPARLLAAKLPDLRENYPGIGAVTTDYPVRVCTQCRSTLFAHRNYLAEARADPPRMFRLHAQLEKLQAQVLGLLPQFEELLLALSTNAVPREHISRVRDSRRAILQLFSKYEVLMRRISEVPVETETETRVRNNILAKAKEFLETTMLPLQSLPQSLQYNEPAPRNKAAAGALQNQLVVLEEQRFLLEQQIRAAKADRHFDALPPLEASLDEISSEVQRLSTSLGQDAPST